MPRVGPVILWEKHRIQHQNGPARYSHIVLHTPTITIQRHGIEGHAKHLYTRLRIGRLTLTWTLHLSPKPEDGDPT